MPSVSVLVVDDYEPICRLIATMLESPAFTIIGRAFDGLEAVQKAAELQPDLILLDIGLPQLNGIEAARRIRMLAPHSRILFVSQETSSDIVQAACSLGAVGYVYKSRIQSDLLPAVQSVLAGRLFVSPGLQLRELTDHANVQAPARHEVIFYSDDAVLIDGVTAFIVRALESNSLVVVAATQSHREAFVRKLQRRGIDIQRAIQKRVYIPLDAAEVLSGIMVNGSPDRVRFINAVTALIESFSDVANGQYSRVAVFGEGVSVLCADGNTGAARRVEALWNSVLESRENLDLLCAYPLGAFDHVEGKHVFDEICKEHSAVRVG